MSLRTVNEINKNPDSAAALALKNIKAVDSMLSNPGEALEDFEARVAERLRNLRDAKGYEYSTASSERAVESQEGKSIQYGVSIQTSGSPFIVVVDGRLRLPDNDGWVRREERDMHIHGKIKTGYTFTALDAAYNQENSMSSRVTAGQRVRRAIDYHGLIDMNNFSRVDLANNHSRLVRARDIASHKRSNLSCP